MVLIIKRKEAFIIKTPITILSTITLGLLMTAPVLASTNQAPKLTADTPLMPFQPGKGETTENNYAQFNHRKLTVCIDPQLYKKPGMKAALKAAMQALPAYHFKLTKNNYHADIVIVPVEFASGQASRVDNYQYQQDPAVIHRSLIEFSYPVANQQSLQNEVLQDMKQAINY